MMVTIAIWPITTEVKPSKALGSDLTILKATRVLTAFWSVSIFASVRASKYGSGFKKIKIKVAARIKVTTAIRYGPTSLGKPSDSASTPAGSIKFGPNTEPTVDAQTTKERSLARFSSVAKSIAPNLA
ncbi:unannotated protein [freshwater metagenome]|uniref:Unannotated protein n=1 Tax=freshwater metagenome TaxID=449393 RepID=A0A6J6WZB2_9ZZZZ